MIIADLLKFWGSNEPKTLIKKLGLHVAVGLILGTLGPYDSSNLPNIALRFSYWVGLLVFSGLISGPIARSFFPWFQKKHQNVQLAFLCFCAVVSVPICFAVVFADLLFVHIIFEITDPLSLGRLLAILSSMHFGLLGYFLLYAQVLLVTVMAFGAVTLLANDHKKKSATADAKPAGYKFLTRLPPELGHELLCLSMEDHYIRAHTNSGSHMMLMRLSDAISELEEYSGTQTHRSWWVAYSAIQTVSKEKRRYVVHLTNGMKVPVSQTYVEKLKALDFI